MLKSDDDGCATTEVTRVPLLQNAFQFQALFCSARTFNMSFFHSKTTCEANPLPGGLEG